ncbi:MAG TPA: hypothetical protein VJK51_01185 [Candidatus Nanoarchaeia archaeon]|nr:hypothetical protein [Candidatus Nanoarchaeia archaeon]
MIMRKSVFLVIISVVLLLGIVSVFWSFTGNAPIPKEEVVCAIGTKLCSNGQCMVSCSNKESCSIPGQKKCDDGVCRGSCPDSATCEDSDGGIDLNVPGTITYVDPSSGESLSSSDKCLLGEPSSPNLNEYWCSTTASGTLTAYSGTVICPNGCKDGSCVAPPNTLKCEVTGADVFTKGSATIRDESNNIIQTRIDRCSDNVLSQSVCVYSYGDSLRLEGWGVHCELGCKDGACIR